MKFYLSMCAALVLFACAGKDGTNGNTCTVTSNPDGSATIACTNGTTTTIEPGQLGATGTTGAVGATGHTGSTCTVSEYAGTATITCPGASTAVSQGLPACGTLAGDFNVTGPADLATFQAAGCTTIDGNLNITSNSNNHLGAETLKLVVTDLSGLSNLTTVTGNVDIEGDTSETANDPSDLLQATSLHGLQNLATVGGDFYLDATTWLTDADLASLTTVTGTLTLGDINGYGNLVLTSVELTDALTFINFDCSGNSALTALPAIHASSVSGNVRIAYNPLMTDIELTQLTTVNGLLVVGSNAALTTLNLSGLTTCNQLLVEDDSHLTTVTLSALTTLGVNIPPISGATFDGLTALTELDLPLLTQGTLQVTDDAALTTLSTPVLATAGFLVLGGDTALPTLDLPLLTTVAAGFLIEENTSLATITVPDLASVQGFTVDDTVVTSLAFPSLTAVTGSLEIDNNADLTSVTFPEGGVVVSASADISNDPELCPLLPISGVTVSTSGDGVCPS